MKVFFLQCRVTVGKPNKVPCYHHSWGSARPALSAWNVSFRTLCSFDDISGGTCKDCPVSFPVYCIIPRFPCSSLQLSCRHAPQGDHWESRQRCWQGMEQCWTAERGSSAAHSREFTGLETKQTKRNRSENASDLNQAVSVRLLSICAESEHKQSVCSM